MKKIRMVCNPEYKVAKVPDLLFGSFVEHLGRCMYGGLYEPEMLDCDHNGFRKEVKALISEAGVTAIRYPGGNFVSGYDWKDGIGPKESRPTRKELAWGTIETNQVGVDEFLPLLQELSIEPLMAVNLGTGTPKEAGELIEYCNLKENTYWSSKRKENGHDAYEVRYWCMGNEMDGDWQINMHTASEYARLLKETAKIAKWIDPSVKVIACGSCTNEIGHKTFGEWDFHVLDEAYEEIDYLSIHRYYNYHREKQQVYERGNDITDYPYFFTNMQSYIDTIKSACDLVKGKKHSSHVVNISFDEWGLVTLTSADPGRVEQNYSFAQYTQLDAVIYGGILCVLLNNCDRVKIACQSLLINEGGMISTSTEGKVLRQSVFYTFRDIVNAVKDGVVIQLVVVEMETVETNHYGKQPVIQMACVAKEEEIILLLANLDRENEVEMVADLGQFGNLKAQNWSEIYTEDWNEVNTFEEPYQVVPHERSMNEVENGMIKEILRPHSWNILQYRKIMDM